MRPNHQDSLILWPAGASGTLGSSPHDVPTLTCYFPKENITGSSIVILPGGSYSHLAAHEGEGYANWLNANGIAAFVVKYRLGSHGYRHPAMVEDAARGIRYVRFHAPDWNLNPTRIGIMGSSAGGHNAAMLMTTFDFGVNSGGDLIAGESSRPDVGILCYPVISSSEYRHDGSFQNLLGKDATAEQMERVSADKLVVENTPPAFLWHTWEDPGVPVENILLFANALRKSKVPFDLHIYERGAHGIGLGPDDKHPWGDACLQWLRLRGFGVA